MGRRTFELVLASGVTRMTGPVGAVWAQVDRMVGGDSTIRLSRSCEGAWRVLDGSDREVGTLYAVRAE